MRTIPARTGPQVEDGQHQGAQQSHGGQAQEPDEQVLDRRDALVHLRARGRPSGQVGRLRAEDRGHDAMDQAHATAKQEQDHGAADDQRQATGHDPEEDLVEVQGSPSSRLDGVGTRAHDEEANRKSAGTVARSPSSCSPQSSGCSDAEASSILVRWGDRDLRKMDPARVEPRRGVMAEQAEQAEQVLAAFVFESGEASRRFLKTVQEIDKVDEHVRIVDAAVADRTKLGRVKIHQTEDRGGMKGGARGGTIGVVVGAILLGPAGAVVGGAAGGLLAGLHNRFHDIGVDDKFMREVAKEMEKGRSALFVLYEGDWSASIGLIETAVKTEGALLIQSTLPAETAAALQQLVAPAVEELGGEDVVADYEVDADEAAAEAAEPAVAEEVDDLTRILGVEPESAAVLQAAGVASYARLAATSEPDLRRTLGDAAISRPEERQHLGDAGIIRRQWRLGGP